VTKYIAIISYDGTDYYGWQVQDDLPTVAGAMQKAFEKVFGKPIKLIAVSRTDAGVHAFGQIISFATDITVEPQAMRFAWNNRLPKNIIIRFLVQRPQEFNLHSGVKKKTYIYKIFTQRPLPFNQRYGWYIPQKFCPLRLQESLNLFIGTHDFKPFCIDDERGDDTIRTINSITINYHTARSTYTITIRGPKFLRYMIRRIVGAAITIAKNDTIPISYITDVLEKKASSHTLINAPPHGLILQKVCYGKTFNDLLRKNS
jgi:tRNA pseudouridine38-40 synthase